jgi:hypothetical protein
VDVLPQRGAGLAESVAKTGPPRVELVEQLRHRDSVELEPARQAREERWERGRKMQLGHR